MKTTKKQLKEIAEVEKKVSEVCDTKKPIEVINIDGVINYDGNGNPKFEVINVGKKRKTTEVTLNDKGVIVNKETGKPHFSKEKKSRDITIDLSFGKSAPTIKEQLKTQGFKIFKGIIIDAELIRTDLHGLHRIGILKEKELLKCFNRLSKKICKVIVDSEIKDDEIAIHIGTKIG
jgi:hypothetical protein